MKAVGAPGHGSKLYDGYTMENLREFNQNLRVPQEPVFDVARRFERGGSRGYQR
jgi:hypothetical protein